MPLEDYTACPLGPARRERPSCVVLECWSQVIFTHSFVSKRMCVYLGRRPSDMIALCSNGMSEEGGGIRGSPPGSEESYNGIHRMDEA